MVDMFFEFTELCTTIPPLEYGGNEVLLDYFASKVKEKWHSMYLYSSFRLAVCDSSCCFSCT